MSGDVPVVAGFADLVEVGRGGFSRVYAAYQMAFDRRVAIKVLNDRLADDESVAAFERECQAMGVLSRHPFIVTVLANAFTSDYRPCIVMDLFERGNYMQLVRRGGSLPREELLSVGVRVAGALATAHQDGVIHGDVKPQNIFKSAFGFPALGDFGIATLRNRAAERVGLGMSPHFVAPELIEEGAAAAAAAADQYSLGATLFTLATGRRPFESDSPQAPQQILARALEAPPPALPDGFPAELAAALRRAMAREPRDRFPDLGAFAVALTNIEYRLGYPPTAIPIAGIDDDATIAIDTDTLAALRQQTTVPTTPADPTGPTPETDAPTTVLAPPRQTPDEPPPGRPPPEPPKRRRRTLLASLTILLAAAAVTAYLVTRDSTPSATAPEQIPAASPQPLPTPQAPPATEPTLTPQQTAGTVQPPPEPAAPAPAAEPEPPPPPPEPAAPAPADEPAPPPAAEPEPPPPPPEPAPEPAADAELYRAVILFPGFSNDESWANAWWDGALVAMEIWPNVTVEAGEYVISKDDYLRDGRGYAEAGYDLVLMANEGMSHEAALVAEKYPEVQVCVGPVDPTPEMLEDPPDNLCFIDIAQHHANFFTGVLAALITETGHIGALGDFNAPALTSQFETFHLGARCVNPDIEFTQKYIETWSDLDLAKTAGHDLIANGVDVIQSATEHAVSGIIVAAIEADNQVWVIPSLHDSYKIAPDVVLTSALQGLSDAVHRVISRDLRGTISPRSVLRLDAANTPGISAAPLRDPALSALGDDDLAVYEDFDERVRKGEIKIPDDTQGDTPIGLEVGIGGRIDLADIGC